MSKVLCTVPITSCRISSTGSAQNSINFRENQISCENLLRLTTCDPVSTLQGFSPCLRRQHRRILVPPSRTRLVEHRAQRGKQSVLSSHLWLPLSSSLAFNSESSSSSRINSPGSSKSCLLYFVILYTDPLQSATNVPCSRERTNKVPSDWILAVDHPRVPDIKLRFHTKVWPRCLLFPPLSSNTAQDFHTFGFCHSSNFAPNECRSRKGPTIRDRFVFSF